MNYDLIVIGSGPGGYVAAIRAAQLGLKTAIVEKESLGGVCLNWGCIPTKALLKSAQVFEYINHAADYGITVNEASADFNAVVKRSRGVADGMSKGIQFLMKKLQSQVFFCCFKIEKRLKNIIEKRCCSKRMYIFVLPLHAGITYDANVNTTLQ